MNLTDLIGEYLPDDAETERAWSPKHNSSQDKSLQEEIEEQEVEQAECAAASRDSKLAWGEATGSALSSRTHTPAQDYMEQALVQYEIDQQQSAASSSRVQIVLRQKADTKKQNEDNLP